MTTVINCHGSQASPGGCHRQMTVKVSGCFEFGMTAQLPGQAHKRWQAGNAKHTSESPTSAASLERTMANAVFTTKVNPIYDDLTELRYHFPKTYFNQARETVADWILYYEPRREGFDPSGTSGRQCYFATARVERIE